MVFVHHCRSAVPPSLIRSYFELYSQQFCTFAVIGFSGPRKQQENVLFDLVHNQTSLGGSSRIVVAADDYVIITSNRCDKMYARRGVGFRRTHAHIQESQRDVWQPGRAKTISINLKYMRHTSLSCWKLVWLYLHRYGSLLRRHQVAVLLAGWN